MPNRSIWDSSSGSRRAVAILSAPSGEGRDVGLELGEEVHMQRWEGTLNALEKLMDDLSNDEERSALRNLIAPAILLEQDKDRDVSRAAGAFLESVEDMLRARVRFGEALSRVE